MIFILYSRSGKTLIELELSINEFIELTSKYGQYSAWTNPYLTVWSIENSIDELLIDIELEKENVREHILIIVLHCIIEFTIH